MLARALPQLRQAVAGDGGRGSSLDLAAASGARITCLSSPSALQGTFKPRSGQRSETVHQADVPKPAAAAGAAVACGTWIRAPRVAAAAEGGHLEVQGTRVLLAGWPRF